MGCLVVTGVLLSALVTGTTRTSDLTALGVFGWGGGAEEEEEEEGGGGGGGVGLLMAGEEVGRGFMVAVTEEPVAVAVGRAAGVGWALE